MTNVFSIKLQSVLNCLSSVFTKIYLKIGLFCVATKKARIFNGILMVIFSHLWLVYFQDKKYVYLFLWCPFSLLKLLIGFRLNALFSGGLKIFYGSICVSSLRQKRSMQVLISL